MAIDLKQFDVSAERGFLPVQDPLTAFTDSSLLSWEKTAALLPKLLASTQTRQVIEALPALNVSSLKTAAEQERAMLLLSYLGHGYVWSSDPPADTLPEILAKAWYAVGQTVGRPPVLSYASYALHNWQRIDPKKPIEVGNICLLQNFMGGIDEEWFILIHVAIEAQAGLAISKLVEAQNNVVDQNFAAITAALQITAQQIEKMYNILARMPEFCDPYIYFNRVRPYIHGWKNNPALPHGLRYAGVAEYANLPQKFRGETGAQSSIIPCLDAALNIEHKQDPLKEYLLEMQDYMPPKHKALIAALAQQPSVRELVKQSKAQQSNLVDAYNSCVRWVEKFRDKHLDYASQYIFQQQANSQSNPSAVGTGGTPFMVYLKKHRDESGEHLIS